MSPRLELNLPAYKRLPPPVDPTLVQRVRDAVYRVGPTQTSQKSSLQDWIQQPHLGINTSSTLPDLQPFTRYQSGLQNLQNRPEASENIGSSYQNQVDLTLQSGQDATQAVANLVAIKQQQIEAKQQQRLMNALLSGRSKTGAVLPAQRRTTSKALPKFSGKLDFNAYGERYYSPNQNKTIVKRVAASMGLTDQEWRYLDYIIQRESSYRNTVKNKKSTAYGIAQFLKGTWATVGGRKTKNPALQAYYMIKYIYKRYKSFYNAYLFKVAHGWY